MDMFTMGIRIPFRPPRGEGLNAFAEPRDRHRHCDASECLCPGGRQEAEEEGPWELLLCPSCAAEGTHRHCSGLRDSITSWECDGCAGLGTAPMEEPEPDGPNLSTQSGLEPSHEPGSISPSTGNQVPSGMSASSPETSNPSTNQQATSEQSLQSPSQETSSPSSESQVKSDSSHSSSSEPEVSTCSSSPDTKPDTKPLVPATSDPNSYGRSWTPHDRRRWECFAMQRCHRLDALKAGKQWRGVGSPVLSLLPAARGQERPGGAMAGFPSGVGSRSPAVRGGSGGAMAGFPSGVGSRSPAVRGGPGGAMAGFPSGRPPLPAHGGVAGAASSPRHICAL
ncbi:translation initiation factor IF-2-like [Chiroxiphia lanceolata]|uniref:translation initiation factor IF-2-like n=1 Tax=Chiroxiphia lanceolata TaxID=296741 RepID=UPI0013CEFFBD|nr:translation initiation factor IF-2-like [Chiroxiphia lanceolata]